MALKLEKLRKHRIFIDNITWDVTPELIFKPRFFLKDEDRELIDRTQGFLFYIDYMDDICELMVLKTYQLRSKTIGEVENVPEQMLLDAVNREGVKDIGGMYPIDEKLESWLKEKLGIK